MDLEEWGEPTASFEADPGAAAGLRAAGIVLLVLGALGVLGLTARGRGLFDDGLFLLPAVAVVLGGGFVGVATAARRWVLRVGPGWVVQRLGVLGRVRGFRVEDVARVRTLAPAYARGERIVSVVVHTADGQRHRLPFTGSDETADVRRAVAEQLLASEADLDPAALAILAEQVDRVPDHRAGVPRGSVEDAARLDDRGRLRRPAGWAQLAVAGYGFTAVGLACLVAAVLGLGAFDDPQTPGVYALVVGPLAAGGLNLWILRRLRARQVAAWHGESSGPQSPPRHGRP